MNGHDPAKKVGVPTDELRRRLHGYVSHKCQRPLIERRSEGIVHAKDRARLSRHAATSAEVGSSKEERYFE